VQMVRSAADCEGIQAELFDRSRKLRDESGFEVSRDLVATFFRAEDHVGKLGTIGVRHGF